MAAAIACSAAMLVMAPAMATSGAPAWRLAQGAALPALDGGVPADAMGCVALGYHVDAEGRVVAPRVLQGAFRGIDPHAQEAFGDAVATAASGWRHARVEGAMPSVPWHSTFLVQAVGFLPGPAAGQGRVVLGVDAQDARLREHCHVDDLARWGEANAVPADEAVARNGEEVALLEPGQPMLLWVPRGPLQAPGYPNDGLRRGISACVVVGHVVRADGTVDGLRIVSSRFSKGPTDKLRKQFEAQAAAAVASGRFSPGPDNLSRTPQFLQIPITFTINDAQAPQCEAMTPGELAHAQAPRPWVPGR
jgi:TonB family protein